MGWSSDVFSSDLRFLGNLLQQRLRGRPRTDLGVASAGYALRLRRGGRIDAHRRILAQAHPCKHPVWISGIKTNTRDFSHRNSVEMHLASLTKTAAGTIENDPIIVHITGDMGLTETGDEPATPHYKTQQIRK